MWNNSSSKGSKDKIETSCLHILVKSKSSLACTVFIKKCESKDIAELSYLNQELPEMKNLYIILIH